MAKDGTNRGGRRVRAGKKPDPLNEKLAQGRPATRLTLPQPAALDLYDFTGDDIGHGVELTGTFMSPPSDYISSEQRDGKPGLQVVQIEKAAHQPENLIARNARVAQGQD